MVGPFFRQRPGPGHRLLLLSNCAQTARPRHRRVRGPQPLAGAVGRTARLRGSGGRVHPGTSRWRRPCGPYARHLLWVGKPVSGGGLVAQLCVQVSSQGVQPRWLLELLCARSASHRC